MVTRRVLTLLRGVRCGVRTFGIYRLVANGFHERPRVAMTNSVPNSGRDSTRPPGPATDRHRDLHTRHVDESSQQALRRMRDAQVGRVPVVNDMGRLVAAISIDDLVLVAQNVRASADVASVVGFHAVGRVERRERGVGSLSRFRDGVRSSVCGGPGRQRGAACGDRPKPDMERTTLSTVLQVLTLVISLVGAIGVLIINSKVDRLTGRIEDVNARTAIIAAVAGGG